MVFSKILYPSPEAMSTWSVRNIGHCLLCALSLTFYQLPDRADTINHLLYYQAHLCCPDCDLVVHTCLPDWSAHLCGCDFACSTSELMYKMFLVCICILLMACEMGHLHWCWTFFSFADFGTEAKGVIRDKQFPTVVNDLSKPRSLTDDPNPYSEDFTGQYLNCIYLLLLIPHCHLSVLKYRKFDLSTINIPSTQIWALL